MTRFLWLLAFTACSSKQAPSGHTGSDDPCAAVRPKIEGLYRAEAEAKEPKRVAEAVADNTAMVLGDCAKAPATVAACVERASSVGEIEERCLERLDAAGNPITR